MADRLAIMPTRRNTLAEPIISTHREKVDKYREKIKYWLRCQLISRRDRYRIGKRITGGAPQASIGAVRLAPGNYLAFVTSEINRVDC